MELELFGSDVFDMKGIQLILLFSYGSSQMQVSLYLLFPQQFAKPQLLFVLEYRERNPDSTSVLAFIEVICSSGPAGV